MFEVNTYYRLEGWYKRRGSGERYWGTWGDTKSESTSRFTFDPKNPQKPARWLEKISKNFDKGFKARVVKVTETIEVIK